MRAEVEHHRVVGGSAAFGEDLGVSWMLDSPQIERFLVHGMTFSEGSASSGR